MYSSGVPQPPRSPSARAHQLVLRFQTIEKVFLVIGCVLLLSGAVAAAALGHDLPADLALSLGSTSTVEGRVLSDRIDRYSRVNLVHPTIFAFSYTADGASRQGESRTTRRELIAKLRQTRKATVVVSRVSSAWARIEGTTVGPYGSMAAGMLVLPAIGLGFVLVVLRRRQVRLGAFTRGEAAPGKLVFKGVNRKIRINGRHPELLRWQFSVAGVPYECSLSSMDAQELAGLAGNEQVTVLYDPRNPANNVPYVA